MRRRSRGARRAVVAALAVVTFPILAACDTSPDSAAVVGSEHISISDLQHQVNLALADPQITAALAPGSQFSQTLGGSQAGFVRTTLTRLISDRLFSAVAAAHHVTVTSKEVSDATAQFVEQAGSAAALQQQAAEGIGVTAAGLPALVRLTVLQQKLSDALVADLPATPAQLQTEYQKDIDTYDELDVAQIAMTNKKLAHQVLAQARSAPDTFPALAKRYSQDTQTQPNGGEVGLVGRSQVVSLLGSAAKAKVGNIELAHSSGEYVILHIISRHLVPISQATAQLKSALFASQAQTLLTKELAAEGKRLGVHVSPRYGHWDAKTETVVANKSATSSAG
ncbi:MAG TPA: peptidylprolyl isomerase [Mycobacteriales bacterium]|nr:peptidylprolyl isomerase [Mycobacteriales bacterium]